MRPVWNIAAQNQDVARSFSPPNRGLIMGKAGKTSQTSIAHSRELLEESRRLQREYLAQIEQSRAVVEKPKVGLSQCETGRQVDSSAVTDLGAEPAVWACFTRNLLIARLHNPCCYFVQGRPRGCSSWLCFPSVNLAITFILSTGAYRAVPCRHCIARHDGRP